MRCALASHARHQFAVFVVNISNSNGQCALLCATVRVIWCAPGVYFTMAFSTYNRLSRRAHSECMAAPTTVTSSFASLPQTEFVVFIVKINKWIAVVRATLRRHCASRQIHTERHHKVTQLGRALITGWLSINIYICRSLAVFAAGICVCLMDGLRYYLSMGLNEVWEEWWILVVARASSKEVYRSVRGVEAYIVYLPCADFGLLSLDTDLCAVTRIRGVVVMGRMVFTNNNVIY